MISDPSNERCRLNPAVMHALFMLEACGENFEQAIEIVADRFHSGDADPKHWLGVFKVLNAESGAQA